MYNEDKTKWFIKDDYVDVFKNERGNYIIGGSNRKHYIDEVKMYNLILWNICG